MRHCARCLIAVAIALAAMTTPAVAVHDGDTDASGMTKLFNAPNSTGAINTDLAFWGKYAYAGNYDGFRVFDVSNPGSPALVTDFKCHGPQNDPVVWRNLLFLGVDRTQTGPECGSTDTVRPDGTAFHDDPNGWEGVRIFDVSNPAAPRFVKAVYTDCGAHTITLYPKNPAQVMLYVSSYPLRPGPTCGPERGPAAGEDPLWGKISVIRVPVNNPRAAQVVAEPRVNYPGDPDNKFDPDEHGLTGLNDLRACHDIGVFVELGLAGAACAEQAQLWRIRPNGLPDTQNPIWVYDDNEDTDGIGSQGSSGDVAVDFWHSATFSWDGKVVNFIDESFGEGCPTRTEAYFTGPADTGRAFFLDTRTGSKLSHFAISRPDEAALPNTPENPVYCSAHLGIPALSPAKLLVNAWYTGGADVIDFNDPRRPFEATFYDTGPGAAAGSDNWSAYWYEGPRSSEPTLTMYGNDGVEHPPSGEGFQVFNAATDVRDFGLPYLNPQTQERVLGDPVRGIRPHQPPRFNSSSPDADDRRRGGRRSNHALEHLAP